MVTVLHAPGLLQHPFGDAVDAAVDGLGVAAPADKASSSPTATPFIERYAGNMLFEKKTEFSFSTKEQLLEDIAFVREQGYAINNQRYEKGMVSISVPVIPKTTRLVEFAISVSGPSTRLLEGQKAIVSELLETAGKIAGLI